MLATFNRRKEKGIFVYHLNSNCISFITCNNQQGMAKAVCVVHIYNSYYNDFSNSHFVVLSTHNLKDNKCVQIVYLTFENVNELNV